MALLPPLLVISSVLAWYETSHHTIADQLVTYVVNPKNGNDAFCWKDADGNKIESIGRLKAFVASRNRRLVFAMNGGMYRPGNTPKSLFIQDFKTLAPLDTAPAGHGSFYTQPDGVFYISGDDTPAIRKTGDFKNDGRVKFATQSGPMLVINGRIQPAFREGSANVQIRNGAGILPGNRILFAISKTKVNFYDLADYFKSMGCKNALYLDGYVSRMYLPSKHRLKTGGNFGVMIAVTKPRTK